MAFFDKLSQAAKTIGDRAGDAVETGKHNAKIMSEKNALAKDMEKIGEFYYAIFAAGGEVAPEAAELFQNAKAHCDAIAAAQAEIERIKAENAAPAPAAPEAPAAAAPVESVCPECGTALAAEVNFCPHCGHKREDEA